MPFILKSLIASVILIFSGVGIGAVVDKYSSSKTIIISATPTLGITPTSTPITIPTIKPWRDTVTPAPVQEYKRINDSTFNSTVYNCQAQHYDEIISARTDSDKSRSDEDDCILMKIREANCDSQCKGISSTWDHKECINKCVEPLGDSCRTLEKHAEKSARYVQLIIKYCYIVD